MTSDLASLLASGERAVFHGPPAAALPDLERALVTAQEAGRLAEVTAAAWLLGVALAASGRYGGALRVLEPLVDAGTGTGATAETRLFASLSAATAASVYRGLGQHATARRLDERGLALADADEARFDCVLGLASDAVGLDEPDVAGQRAAEAADVAAAHEDWWRQRVRLDWTRAEIALLADDPAAAVTAAAAAVDRAEGARAPRHVAKSLLFQGVAEAQSGAAHAASTLRRAATLAEQVGAAPVTWQARAILGALLADTDAAESTRCLGAARSVLLEIAADLPDDVRNAWFARPNVAALLGA